MDTEGPVNSRRGMAGSNEPADSGPIEIRESANAPRSLQALFLFDREHHVSSADIACGIDYPNHCKIKSSTDGGITWNEISTNSVTWGSLFYANDALYMIGNNPHTRSIIIVRSESNPVQSSIRLDSAESSRIFLFLSKYSGLAV